MPIPPLSLSKAFGSLSPRLSSRLPFSVSQGTQKSDTFFAGGPRDRPKDSASNGLSHSKREVPPSTSHYLRSPELFKNSDYQARQLEAAVIKELGTKIVTENLQKQAEEKAGVRAKISLQQQTDRDEYEEMMKAWPQNPLEEQSKMQEMKIPATEEAADPLTAKNDPKQTINPEATINLDFFSIPGWKNP